MANNQIDFNAQFGPVKLENCGLKISDLINGDYNDILVSIRGQIGFTKNGDCTIYDGSTPYLLPVVISPYFNKPDGLVEKSTYKMFGKPFRADDGSIRMLGYVAFLRTSRRRSNRFAI